MIKRIRREHILTIIAITILLFLGGTVLYVFSHSKNGASRDSTQLPLPIITSSSFVTLPPATSTPTVTPQPLPNHITLDVPFLVQAPFAIWDALHEEACEEASLIMVKYFRDKQAIGSREGGDQEILNLVDYETKNGYAVDVTLAQLSEIAARYYNLTTGRVETDVSVQTIKTELAAGRPVIIPAAGRVLPNPYFTGGGPNYHMLVIRGYDKNGFITNDPGTRRGEGFHYSFDDLLNAVHDWDPSNILLGQKAYLVFD